MALTKITPQMFDTSATAHDLNVDNGTFVVDGSASRVGIGTDTPNTLLDVNGAVSSGDIEITSTNRDMLHLKRNASNGDAGINFENTSGNLAQIYAESSGDFVIDTGGDIILDADGADIILKDGGTHWASLTKDGNTTAIKNAISNGAIQFQGIDGSTAIAALTLDMSDEGTATFNHDVKLGDSSVLFIGAAPALSFYHDGNNSYVQNQTGALIHTTATFVVNNAANTENMLSAYENGAVTLYYDHSAKLATTSGGISVTGTIDSTGTMTATAGSNSAALTSLGSVELVRGGGNPFIDFKTSTSEDYDCRIQQDTNGLKLIVGGQGSTGTAITIDSGKNSSFAGSVNLGSTTDGSRRFKWFNDNYHSLYYDNNLLGASSSADVITYYQNFVFRHQDATNAVIIGGSSGTISCGAITSTGAIFTPLEAANALKARFLMGKDSGNTNDGDLYINYATSHNVFLGAGGGNSSLTATGVIKGGDGTASAPTFAFASDPNTGMYRVASDNLGFAVGGSRKVFLSTSQLNISVNTIPAVDNTYDLGSTTGRWRNIYTGDLHLSNEGSKNDVDGTSGNWTIQEGETDLYIINNKSGKKYRFALEEID